jgi:hypothetical protein
VRSRRIESTCARTFRTGLKEMQKSFRRWSQMVRCEFTQDCIKGRGVDYTTTIHAKSCDTLTQFKKMNFIKCFKWWHVWWSYYEVPSRLLERG